MSKTTVVNKIYNYTPSSGSGGCGGCLLMIILAIVIFACVCTPSSSQRNVDIPERPVAVVVVETHGE